MWVKFVEHNVMPIPNGILCKIGADFTLGSQPFLFLTILKNQHKVYAKNK